MGERRSLLVTQRIAGATLMVAGFAIMTGLIIDNFRPAQAEDTTVTMRVGGGSLALTIDNSGPCSGFDTANNILDINVINGSIASNCIAVTASTNAPFGYTLSLVGPEDLTTSNNLALTPTSGTMEQPTAFASQHTGGVWGFAIPNGQIHGLDFGFDNSYQVLAHNNTTNTARFAAVPTIPTAFSTTDAPNTTPDTYNIFFAVATGPNIPVGSYSGMVTVSGFVNVMSFFDCNALGTSFDTGCTDRNVSVVLPEGMIGVRYTGMPFVPEWTISGPTDPLWYDYADKQWANAVTFQTPANRDLPVGTVLDHEQVEDILGFWVYIPRFEYRLINTGFDGISHCGPDNPQHCPQAFDVRFVRRDAPIQSGTQVGEWLTHPGFIVNNQQVSGLWMAKYAASLDRGDGDSCINTSITNCNITLDPNGNRASTFVPIVSPWTNINLFNIHQNVQNIPTMHGINYSNQNNFIVNGLTNASWGAAAYLSQSLYGVCTNRYCSYDGTRLIAADGENMQKIYNNGYYHPSDFRYLTGCGPAGPNDRPNDEPYTQPRCTSRAWHTRHGMLASSNHNPTGIFDLAGGVWESTFSARANPTDTTTFTNWRNSGLNASNFNFNRFSDLLYFDTDFTNCIDCGDWQPIKSGSFAGLPRYFGLALAETVAQNADSTATAGGWGGDQSSSMNATSPWFVRGGHSSNAEIAGVFAFGRNTGESWMNLGWRAVIAGS